MNKQSAFRVGALLIVAALFASACSAGDQLGPVGLEPSAEFQAAEPQGADVTVQVGLEPAPLTAVPLTPSLPESPCSEGEMVGPVLYHPDADAIDSGVGTTFSWNYLECAVWGWEFELCATEDCRTSEFGAYLSPYPNISLGWALQPGSTHYWRAAAWLMSPPDGPRGPWSETRRLTVTEACADAGQLAAPELEAPEDGSTQYAMEMVGGQPPDFHWSAAEGCQPSDYLLELTADPTFGQVTLSHRMGAPVSYWLMDQDLQPDVTYYWHVAPMLGEAIGPHSDTWSFVTTGVPQGLNGMLRGRVWSDVCARPPGWDWGDPTPPGCEFREGGLSANGAMDPGETGLGGVTLSYNSGVCPPGPGQTYSVVTGGNGDYSMPLPDGYFCVWLDSSAGGNASVLAGGRPTYPACFYDSMDPCTIQLAEGEILSDFNFGWELPAAETGALGSISGMVWKDKNSDGERSAFETGLANVEVRLTCVGCPGAGTPAFTSTDSQGNYTFGSLASATYSVEVAKEFPANAGIFTSGGWTRPPVSGTWAAIQIVLAGGEDRGGVDFGWSSLTLFRPPFRLLPTLQFFLPVRTLQLYRASAPTPMPRPFYVMPTATRVFIRPMPTETRVFIRSTPTATRVFIPIPPTATPVPPKPTATPPPTKS